MLLKPGLVSSLVTWRQIHKSTLRLFWRNSEECPKETTSIMPCHDRTLSTLVPVVCGGQRSGSVWWKGRATHYPNNPDSEKQVSRHQTWHERKTTDVNKHGEWHVVVIITRSMVIILFFLSRVGSAWSQWVTGFDRGRVDLKSYILSIFWYYQGRAATS